MDTLSEQVRRALEHFQQDLNSLRVGRAVPAIVENVLVDYYGAPTALQQLASITAADARTLVIQPWDANCVKDVERALTAADLGTTPVVDGKVLRVTLPALTEERRQELVKVLNERSEKARVAVRQHREEHIKEAKRQKDTRDLSEDAFFSQQKEIQKSVDEAIGRIEELQAAKQTEIMTI